MKTSEILILILTIVLSIIALVNAIVAYIQIKIQLKDKQNNFVKYSENNSFYFNPKDKVSFTFDDKLYLSSKENVQQEIDKNSVHKNSILAFY